MSKKTYEKRKAQGLCVNCGKNEAKKGRVMCQSCCDNQSKKRKQDREYFKSIKICPRCQKNKLFGDEKNCLDCREKMYYVNIKSRANDPDYSSKVSEQYYKRKELRQKNHLCLKCGKRPMLGKHTYCEKCLVVKRERTREIQAINHIPRGLRTSYGLCWFCGNPTLEGYKTCEECKNRVTKNLKPHKNMEWDRANAIIFNK